MFAMLTSLPFAIAAGAFLFIIFCIAAGLTLGMMIMQFFIVRYKSKRAGLVLPVIAICVFTLFALSSFLVTYRRTSSTPDPLPCLLSLLTVNIPAALLFLERHIILKQMRKKGLLSMENSQ